MLTKENFTQISVTVSRNRAI